MHCVARQNKLETPKEKDEVNKREVHECDVRTRDPDAMVVPPTPKPTCKAGALARAPPTIASSCEGNAALKKWHVPQLRCAS
jgi:hypothetical protein